MAQACFRLDPTVRRLDGGRVLVGGTPLKLVRLTPGGASIIDRIEAGQPVALGTKARTVIERFVDDGILHPDPGPDPIRAQDVTIVIPVRDRPDGLAATLASIGPVKRVVVVDDGSLDPDATLRVARLAGADVEIRATNGGPAAARNTGLAQVTTDVVAFVDAGCTPEPGWLEVLLGHLTDPSVALVAGRIGGRPLRRGGSLARYESVRSALDLGPLPAPVRPGSRVAYVPAACLVGRTRVINGLGGFAAAMHVGEDVDLVWRLVESGYRVRYEPSARAGHDDRTELRAWASRRFDYGRSAAPLARLHPGNLRPLGVSGWTAAVWALVAAGRPGAAGLLATGTGLALTTRLRGLDHPVRDGLGLAWRGHLGAGRVLASAVTRTWWPVALAAAISSKRARTVLAVAAAGPALVDWIRERPPLDPLRWTALRLSDDAAYGAGVWIGCIHERIAEPVLPSFRNWPGR
jgi:mycofactocin system glycosyltransferase